MLSPSLSSYQLLLWISLVVVRVLVLLALVLKNETKINATASSSSSIVIDKKYHIYIDRVIVIHSDGYTNSNSSAGCLLLSDSYSHNGITTSVLILIARFIIYTTVKLKLKLAFSNLLLVWV